MSATPLMSLPSRSFWIRTAPILAVLVLTAVPMLCMAADVDPLASEQPAMVARLNSAKFYFRLAFGIIAIFAFIFAVAKAKKGDWFSFGALIVVVVLCFLGFGFVDTVVNAVIGSGSGGGGGGTGTN